MLVAVLLQTQDLERSIIAQVLLDSVLHLPNSVAAIISSYHLASTPCSTKCQKHPADDVAFFFYTKKVFYKYLALVDTYYCKK